MLKIAHYSPPQKKRWSGRKDSLPGERFFQHVECLNIQTHALPDTKMVCFLGFCSDEGIRRNEGRIGASQGPSHLREALAKLACHTHASFLDLGDILCHEQNLEKAQDEFAKVISYCHQHGFQTVALGGGHEIAFAHFSGLSQHYSDLGIINFDAHFDLRPYENKATSGTPFSQIKSYCEKNQLNFGYCCLGIQPNANTKSLFERADNLGVNYLCAEDMNPLNMARQIDFLKDFMKRYSQIYLTICMDVFAECFAPGVSAPQPLGLTPEQTLPLLKYVVETGKVVSLDLAELSPPYDQEGKTSRLGASLLAEILNLNQRKEGK